MHDNNSLGFLILFDFHGLHCEQCLQQLFDLSACFLALDSREGFKMSVSTQLCVYVWAAHIMLRFSVQMC